MYFNSINTNL
jgi:hypothetical protein